MYRFKQIQIFLERTKHLTLYRIKIIRGGRFQFEDFSDTYVHSYIHSVPGKFLTLYFSYSCRYENGINTRKALKELHNDTVQQKNFSDRPNIFSDFVVIFIHQDFTHELEYVVQVIYRKFFYNYMYTMKFFCYMLLTTIPETCPLMMIEAWKSMTILHIVDHEYLKLTRLSLLFTYS